MHGLPGFMRKFVASSYPFRRSKFASDGLRHVLVRGHPRMIHHRVRDKSITNFSHCEQVISGGMKKGLVLDRAP